MHHDFWHDKWAKKEIGFHLSAANPLLVQYLPALRLTANQRVFLPLCGKTHDIGWLRQQGYRVCGAELSETAIAELFDELGLEPEILQSGGHTLYRSEGLDMFVGDFFALTPKQLGPIDAIYDRAALVALPEAMRAQYSEHLRTLAPTAPQLLICFEYDQTLMPGPPFSVNTDEVHRHYDASYTVTALARPNVEGGLKGQCPATEPVWLLSPRA